MLWSINKAVVDFDSVDNDDIKESLLACKFAVRLGMNAESIKYLPAFNLIFDTTFLDKDASAYFKNSNFLIPFDQADAANTVTAYCQDKKLQLSITCKFVVDVVDGMDESELTDWIYSNQLWTYISACGPWTYTSDEGGKLSLTWHCLDNFDILLKITTILRLLANDHEIQFLVFVFKYLRLIIL